MYSEPFNLDAKRYQQQVINTGGKKVTIPKGDIESSKGQVNKKSTNSSQYDTSKYNQ